MWASIDGSTGVGIEFNLKLEQTIANATPTTHMYNQRLGPRA